MWPFKSLGNLGKLSPAQSRPAPRRGSYDLGQVENHLRDAVALAEAIGKDPEIIRDETRDLGYNHLHSAEVAAGEISHGFQHQLEDHRLIINQCTYPDMVRHMIHVHIPGKMPPQALSRVRGELGFAGSEGLFEATYYAHWKRPGREAPLFTDIWIDNFEGRGTPLTRMMIEVFTARKE